jgi:hypothetical protein
MTIAHDIGMVAALVLICADGASGQTRGAIQSETARSVRVHGEQPLRYQPRKVARIGRVCGGRSGILCG